MAKYFHVAPMTYQNGDDLLSWDRHIDRYGEVPCDWKWGGDADEGYDGHMVCVWREDQVRDMEEMIDWIFDGVCKVLTIETDAGWEEELRFGTNGEGCTAAMTGCIPAELITAVDVREQE